MRADGSGADARRDRVRWARAGLLAGALALVAGCTPIHPVENPEFARPAQPRAPADGTAGDNGAPVADDGTVVAAREDAEPGRAPEPAPASPAEVPPGAKGDEDVWHRALSSEGDRIVIARDARWLWLMRGDSAVFSAPVAVGRDTIFEYRGNSWDFSTPTGRMTVLGKEESPLWVPPDWHYFEKAVEDDLEPIHLEPNDRIELSDGSVIEVRGTEVGRINQFGNWRAFRPGQEIIFYGRIFIPPLGSPQRRIPDELGTHRLILRDGYLIHGTPKTDTIGEYASHGCVRMFNHDIEYLYGQVDTGIPVYIY